MCRVQEGNICLDLLSRVTKYTTPSVLVNHSALGNKRVTNALYVLVRNVNTTTWHAGTNSYDINDWQQI